jgi:trans-aconitate methyltransferase
MGYIIHPSIAKRLPPNARIADLATGTGVFLKRLAPAYPEAVLDGYDISSALFPEKTALPSNMNLSVLDVKQPVPKQLHGTYDLVHVRLIIAGMLPDDWKVVVRNLSRLLKPGGAMQWEEGDYISAQQYRGRVDSTFTAVRSMEMMMIDALRDRFLHGWKSLADDMTAAGLTHVERDVVSSDRVPETREGITINSIVGCFHWARSGKDQWR